MVGKTFSSLIFWKHGAVYKFYGAIDISFQRLRFSHRVSTYMHLSKCEIFHSYHKSQKFFTFFTFLDQSS